MIWEDESVTKQKKNGESEENEKSAWIEISDLLPILTCVVSCVCVNMSVTAVSSCFIQIICDHQMLIVESQENPLCSVRIYFGIQMNWFGPCSGQGSTSSPLPRSTLPQLQPVGKQHLATQLLAHIELSVFGIFIVVVRFIWLSCPVYFYRPLIVFTVSANMLSSVSSYN